VSPTVAGAWSIANAAFAVVAILLSAAIDSVWLYVIGGAASLGVLALLGRPLTLASRVTVARAALAALSVAIVVDRPVFAAGGLLASALLDLADGALARRRQEVTAVGAQLDVETDAYLVAAASLAVWMAARAGPWVLAPALLRPLLIGVRMAVRAARGGAVSESRTAWGRAAFAVLVSGLIAVCAVDGELARGLLAAGTVAVVCSFGVELARVVRV
jgi:phosphatidylglycerophosphate synthase